MIYCFSRLCRFNEEGTEDRLRETTDILFLSFNVDFMCVETDKPTITYLYDMIRLRVCLCYFKNPITIPSLTAYNYSIAWYRPGIVDPLLA